MTRTHFRSLYMLAIQLAIPLCRKFHFAGLDQLDVFIKTDPHKFLVLVSDDVSNALKATSITSPSTCARNTARKLLVFIPGRHATCNLGLRKDRHTIQIRS
jgi:hypothetical protein